jgi:hypothetical protein
METQSWRRECDRPNKSCTLKARCTDTPSMNWWRVQIWHLRLESESVNHIMQLRKEIRQPTRKDKSQQHYNDSPRSVKMDGFLNRIHRYLYQFRRVHPSSKQTLKNVLKEKIAVGNNEPSSCFLSIFPFSLSFSGAGIAQSV